MSPTDQQIAIAKACGKVISQCYGEPGEVLPNTVYIDTAMGGVINCPDYLNDLNAMHEAEKLLDKHTQFDVYCRWLIKNCGRNDPFGAIKATAAQRAEAFLRTLNLWTD